MNLKLIALGLVLLAISTQVHVTIWIAGRPVAHPPVAGLILAAGIAGCAVMGVIAWRVCRGFRSSPCWRVVTAT